MNIIAKAHPARRALDAKQEEIAALEREILSLEKAPLAAEDIRAELQRAVDSAWNASLIATLLRGRQRRGAGTTTRPLPTVDSPWALEILRNAKNGDIEHGKRAVVDMLLLCCGVGPGAVSLAEREEKIAELRKKVFSAEFEEERLVLDLIDQRYDILRRINDGTRQERLARAQRLLDIWADMAPMPREMERTAPVDPPRHINEGAAHTVPDR